ncbi:Reverse transcriptase zinc-binding domain - like 7 [Theobroma cacao]|nr:Reverse transcriptase zinc-binding domain - like 7 [Theobroma cacao]
MKEILLVRSDLEKRKLNVEKSCLQYGEEEESMMHAIEDCSLANAVWEQLNFKWSSDSNGFLNVAELLLGIFGPAELVNCNGDQWKGPHTATNFAKNYLK